MTSGVDYDVWFAASTLLSCLLHPSPNPLSSVAVFGDSSGKIKVFDIRSRNCTIGFVQQFSDAKDGVSR